MVDDDKFYVDIVGQILDGFSEFVWEDKTIYIKHHGFKDQAIMPRLFEKYKEEAIIEGVPTEETAIKEAIERGDWSEEKEKIVTDSNEKIKGLTQAAKQLKVPSQKSAQFQLIKEEKEKIKKKSLERQELTSYTAENMAYKRTNDEFMEEIMFLDKDFKKPFMEDEAYSDVDYHEVARIQMDIYNQYTDENISKAVLRPFFAPFLPFAGKPMDFFGKPIIKMTVFQLKVITYGRLFFNIFKNFTNIPKIIKQDPDAILEFIDSESDSAPAKAPEKKTKGEEIGAKTYFGANKEDIKELKEDGQRVVSLSEEVRKHGGKMNMQQMMEMMED